MSSPGGSQNEVDEGSSSNHRGRERQRDGTALEPVAPVRCINPASDINARLDTQVEVRVYPCNNSSQGGGKKKFTTFTIKPEVSSYMFVLTRLSSCLDSIFDLFLSGCHHSRVQQKPECKYD
jgi:hypothetical protein